jgi:tRNA (guanine37-N1)-methyltransferase
VRIDVVSIFPEYLAPLRLSLAGKAQDSGVLDVRVHDLRDWTHDRHRTVDDTPYGGGAGMVMKPEPWGEALDALLPPGPVGERPTLVVPTPSGVPFTQATARELAAVEHLVFACGRYAGIDQRVIDDADTAYDVRELSLGDFVLNGGEVAAAAIIEAVVRLLPGFMGNPESLAEESHEDGLLEYPVYTKPASWTSAEGRTREVPPVLLSGDHAAIAAWRHQQRLERTATRRPDLLHASQAAQGDLAAYDVALATAADAPEIVTLGLAAWAGEFAQAGRLFGPGHDTVADLVAGLAQWRTWVVRAGGRLVASVRGRVDPEHPTTWQIGRLMVAPDLQGRGLGRALLAFAERQAPSGTAAYWLNTGATSERNLRTYRKAGYRVLPGPGSFPDTVDLTKRVTSSRPAG